MEAFRADAQSIFWSDAQSLFETARQAAGAGSDDCDLAIVVGRHGGIHMLPAEGWALPGLMAQHGAQAVYRITRQSGRVRLEGRSGNGTCVLQSQSPAETARRLLATPLPGAAGITPPWPALPAPAGPGIEVRP